VNGARTLANLSADELSRHLATAGVFLRLPPFVMHIRSSIPVVAQGLRILYADHEFLVGADVFADFHVSVEPKLGVFKRLCVFELDGFRPFTPLARNEAFAFLEWGMNWCVTSYAHNWLTIHSAVLEKDGHAVILPAPPGSGKSTLCAALMLDGWRLLSDEMALLDPTTGHLTPFPRPVSLKNESIDVIRERAPSVATGPVARDTMKGHVVHVKATDASHARSQVTAVPAWVVFPRFVHGSDLQVEVRPKSRALVELASNSFNHHVHGKQGFEMLADLVDRCPCFDFRYGDLDQALAWFAALEPLR
jgi:HprK-related kinase A